jgi:hypothetical protein
MAKGELVVESRDRGLECVPSSDVGGVSDARAGVTAWQRGAHRNTVARMRRSAIGRRSSRPPESELYDRGSELVEAAAAIRRLAGTPGAAPAVPAVLGCVEESLHQLLGGMTELERTSVGALDSFSRDAAGEHGPRVARMRRAFVNLKIALHDAHRASKAARALAARALAEGDENSGPR